MNMAEANGALLAAGDVSILYFFPKFPFDHAIFNKCKDTIGYKCSQV